MDDYDSQSTVEDVSEWAEHIEDLIEELQRNYKIIQTEISCLVEKLQLINQKPKNYISKRVVLPKKYSRNNENSRNIRNCCNNCHGISLGRNIKGENISINDKPTINMEVVNEQYVSNIIQNNLPKIEKLLLEKLERNFTHQNLEFQRNITDLKIQQSITETTVRDIAIQIQQIATEVKEMKNNAENKIQGNNPVIFSKKNEIEDIEDSSSSSSLTSDLSSNVCTCTCNNSKYQNDNKVELIEILRDLFVEDEELVGIGNNLEGVELENLSLVRQLFKDFVRLLTQKRIEDIEKSLGELRNKMIKDEKINENRIEDINKLIKDELLEKSIEYSKINNLEQKIQGVILDINNLQDNILELKNKTDEKIKQNELYNNEKIQILEKELITRSELTQMAVKELNEEYKSIKKSQEIGLSFGNELSKITIEKITSIKELLSYITEDLFKNEEKLQKQIKKNTLNIEDLKKCCLEFEKYSDDNFIEIANSIQNFRLQTITILSSIYEIINENSNGLMNFQNKLQEDFPEANKELYNLLDQPHFFSYPKNININNSDNSTLEVGKINMKNSNSILSSSIPPNAYHITSKHSD